MCKPVFTGDMTIEDFIATVYEVAMWPGPDGQNAAVSCFNILASKLHSHEWEIVDLVPR